MADNRWKKGWRGQQQAVGWRRRGSKGADAYRQEYEPKGVNGWRRWRTEGMEGRGQRGMAVCLGVGNLWPGPRTRGSFHTTTMKFVEVAEQGGGAEGNLGGFVGQGGIVGGQVLRKSVTCR